MLNNKTRFDLEERTAKFGENVLNFCKTIYLSTLNESLIKQLIRSATSIGANYMEANGSDSRRDFKNKISICKKESKETTYWLELIYEINPALSGYIKILEQESKELRNIFTCIIEKTR